MVQTDMKASTAFRYDTGGNDACDFACCVDSVSNDVTPKVTRAGAASGFIQNDTHWKSYSTNIYSHLWIQILTKKRRRKWSSPYVPT